MHYSHPYSRQLRHEKIEKSSKHLADGGVVLGLEPLNAVGLGDLVAVADGGLAALATSDASTRTSHDAVEVHSVNTNTRVVLDSEIDVLGDTETEVAGLGEVPLAKLVLLDLESTLKNLLGLGATDGDVDGNLFVPSDTEGTDGVAGLGVDGSLTRELLQHLGGTGKPVTRLSDANVENELLDLELPHGVVVLSFSHCICGCW